VEKCSPERGFQHCSVINSDSTDQITCEDSDYIPSVSLWETESDESDKYISPGGENVDDIWHTINEDEQSYPYFSDDQESEDNIDLRTDLAEWATAGNEPHTQVNKLLKILQKQHLDVPACATTLLQTPRNIKVLKKSGYYFIYFVC
jgi:hypothetical protein